MKIRISDKNSGINDAATTKLRAILKIAQRRAQVRTIDTTDVVNAVSELQNRLDCLMLKKSQIGVSAVVDVHAQNFSGAYKYIPESTVFEVEKTASGWFMTSCGRSSCRAENRRIALYLTAEHQAAVVDFVSQYKNW